MTNSELELNLELSRRLEFAEAEVAVEGANTMMGVNPATTVAVERVAGGYAVYCGANSPITQAVGLGLNGPVSAEEFDRLEEFYFSRNEPVRAETSPLADTSLFALYRERGYGVTEFSNVMVRPIERDERWTETDVLAVGRNVEGVMRGELRACLRRVNRGAIASGQIVMESVLTYGLALDL